MSSRAKAGGSGGGGGIGGGGGMLFGLVFSRFGIGGVIVLVLILFVLGGNPLGLSGGGEQAVSPQASTEGRKDAANVCATDPTIRFSCQVGLTEDRWTELFTEAGSATSRRGWSSTIATRAPAAARHNRRWALLLPLDRGIYLDPDFFRELAQRHAAPGDFAQAYVIAHEVGHHVQALSGIADAVRNAQSRGSEEEGNALQVRMELQADCLAGVWAARERTAMEPGDLEEGMTAAGAIGDDTLQRAGQGHVVPESFTHGSSAQRQEALMRGWRGGNLAACESYTARL